MQDWKVIGNEETLFLINSFYLSKIKNVFMRGKCPKNHPQKRERKDKTAMVSPALSRGVVSHRHMFYVAGVYIHTYICIMKM